jgi:hypothetical protein
MPMLPTVWVLRASNGDVLLSDTEAFCAHLIRKRCPIELTHHQREWLTARLLYRIAELADRYQPGRIRGGFTTWAGYKLVQAIQDELRSADARAEGLPGRTIWRFAGSTHQRHHPDIVSLDELGDHPDLGRHEEDRPADLLRALTPRDRSQDQPADQQRQRPTRDAA